MLLSKVELAAGAGRTEAFWKQVRSGYTVHQLVWSWFAGEPDARRDFLYRHEEDKGPGCFFVLSAREPRDPTGLWRIASKPFAPKLKAGERLRFSLRANPTVKRDGKRHDVVMDARWKARQAEGERQREVEQPCLDWLEARGERCRFGFERDEVRVEAYRQERFGGRGARNIRVSVVDFEGILTVRDPAAFIAALERGIGPAKGFGCGLMLVKRL
ncbi:MAG: type I-E CRISPR-associated protein Cas6/Cse3/CasE [Myxococcales bacterium]|jgi:CRISPR system Cascade subunit CasE